MSKGRFFLLRGQLYVLEYPRAPTTMIERLPTEEEAGAAIDSLMEAVRDGRFNPVPGSRSLPARPGSLGLSGSSTARAGGGGSGWRQVAAVTAGRQRIGDQRHGRSG